MASAAADWFAKSLQFELAEAREQQAATAEILRVISSSPMDLRHVFAEMAASAARVCDVYDATIRQVEDACLVPLRHGSFALGPSVTPESGHRGSTRGWCVRAPWRRMVQGMQNFVGGRGGILLSIQKVGCPNALRSVNSGQRSIGERAEA